jgi:TM2 domain-containing membrane protein YozV
MIYVIHYLPELEKFERTYIQSLVGRMTAEQVLMFAQAYRQHRKDPQTVLLASIIGLAFPGFQRFWLGHIRIGFLHLFTWGLLFIGTISDLVRYKTLALLYNQGLAREIAADLQLRVIVQPRSASNQPFQRRPLHNPRL